MGTYRKIFEIFIDVLKGIELKCSIHTENALESNGVMSFSHQRQLRMRCVPPFWKLHLNGLVVFFFLPVFSVFFYVIMKPVR